MYTALTDQFFITETEGANCAVRAVCFNVILVCGF